MLDILHLRRRQSALSDGPALPGLVAESIRESIRRGRLAPSERLPSEPRLAGQFGVSRNTVRDALRILTTEGFLLRQHGVGTFVSPVAPSLLGAGLAELKSTTELIRQHGYRSGTTAGSRVETVRPEGISGLFGLADDTLFIHLSRTRSADGSPVIHCEEYVPAATLGDAFDGTMKRGGDWSLYEMLRQAGIRIASATCNVVAVGAGDLVADRLKVSPGHALLLLKQIHYTRKGQPVLYCENYHNTDRIGFHVVRGA